jgi:hypothetical protein
MKKSILLVAAIFSIAVMFTSCKDTKKEEVNTESHEGHDHEGEEMAAGDVYQCPMDCEKGKTYEEAGSCPVCKMDLKVKAADGEMLHSDNCTCKQGGECTCEGGKCQCQEADEVVSNTSCTKCEPGKCSCKAEAITTANEGAKCGANGKCACKA